MKKISLFLMCAVFSTALLAQHIPNVGIKGGLNLATWKVDGQNSDALDMRTGFHLGVFSHVHITPKLAFQPELQYSTQGAENPSTDDEYRTGHINVPLMLQYMFNNGFRIEAGPQIGFLVNAKDEAPNGTERDAKGDYKKTDVAIGLGLNYLTYSGFGFGGRYNYGVSNINDRLGADTYNRVLQLSVFYIFNNHHKAVSR